MRNTIVQSCKSIFRIILPLGARKILAQYISQQSWISSDHRAGWSLELVRDMADINVNEYHKFLWSNHIGYADTYEIEQRFGDKNINESRKLLFSDMQQILTELKIDYQNEIESVLDIGSSLGYLLKYMEDNIFTTADVLHGVDIDAYAIDEGSSYLRAHDSKIQLTCLDMEVLTDFLENNIYDIIFCAGTLIYLEEDKARELIKTLMKHTGKLLVITSIASPDVDNCKLEKSEVRKRDGSFIHNVDAMAKNAGGKIVFRRWEGKKMLDGNSLYFIFVTPN
ncbi:MAG: class I SAM-dependent methyltransferase [Thiohalomonadales bacterium]